MDPLTSAEQDAQGRGFVSTPLAQPEHSTMEDVGMSTDDEVSSHPDLGIVEPSEPSLERPIVKNKLGNEFDRQLKTLDRTVFLPNVASQAALRDQVLPAITITDASKAYELSGSSYIAYTIETDIPSLGIHFEAKHRYSEFEGLRKLLTKLHPYCIVPPIPEKHSVKDYAAKPGKAKENPAIIDKRKRLLQSFLNRIACHPILQGEHVFHRFIRGEGSWSDILIDSGLSYHLKKKETVVKVSERAVLKNPDEQFVAAEDYTNRFASQIGFIRKHFKDIHKGYEEVVSLSANLGTLYNGWSLQEEKLSEAIEKTGESVDLTTVATKHLCLGIQGSLGMFLKEYEQLSKSVDKVLRWRHKKHAEFETLSESLVTKQTTLGKLESTEHESQRLNAVLSAEGIPYTPPTGAHHSNGILGAINSLIDSDPESTRRKNISKTKDKISTIEEQREASRHQLIAANAAIQKELNAFQRQKVFDFRNALLSFAMSQRDYHRKVLNAWQENKGVVDKITL